LKDENKYLKLNDTTLFTLTLLKPNEAQGQVINIDNDTLKFVPAGSGANSENAAYLIYTPKFVTNGSYNLEVKGKDKSGNTTGDIAYKTEFQIETKEMISDLLNYPNPFTTQTQFVFILTGNHVPDNLKIQIFSATGRVVREITKNELGPIHVGRNITEYAWNGTDEFGDKLANGVYFYKFITSDKGEVIIKYTDNGNLDKIGTYFKKGMGKMVIMR
jgi:flagellar hook assembly protein FlgD